MAQLNITLNQEEILQLLCNDRDEAFKQRVYAEKAVQWSEVCLLGLRCVQLV